MLEEPRVVHGIICKNESRFLVWHVSSCFRGEEEIENIALPGKLVYEPQLFVTSTKLLFPPPQNSRFLATSSTRMILYVSFVVLGAGFRIQTAAFATSSHESKFPSWITDIMLIVSFWSFEKWKNENDAFLQRVHVRHAFDFHSASAHVKGTTITHHIKSSQTFRLPLIHFFPSNTHYVNIHSNPILT